MSFATEGSEEIFVQVAQETRQASIINQICMKIDEILAQKQNQTLVKITLPELDECNVNVLQAIFDKYNAEMINKDLFIKVDGALKTEVQFKLAVSGKTYNRNWFIAQGTSCMMMGNKYNPDVGFWFIKPTYAQRHNPYANGCLPPDVYIEVFYNRDPNHGFTYEKLTVIQQNLPLIEFIGIALPDRQGPFHQNPNPAASVPATPQNPPNVRPTRAPYFVYWNGTNLVYYKIDWNEHLVLRCGWTMELNDVLDPISDP